MKYAKKIIPFILMVISIFPIIPFFCMTISYASTPDTTIIQSLGEYGLPGVIIISMGWFILYIIKKNEKSTDSLHSRFDKIDKAHREERISWQKVMDKRQERLDIIIDKNTEALTEHSIIITELKTLITNLINKN
jgi:hypothetical protein